MFPKIIGYTVVIFSILNLVCVIYGTAIFLGWEKTNFKGICPLIQEKQDMHVSNCPTGNMKNQKTSPADQTQQHMMQNESQNMTEEESQRTIENGLMMQDTTLETPTQTEDTTIIQETENQY